MIFVTTGTQLPFTRLVKAMNTLALKLDEQVVAQVGPDPDIGTYGNLTIHPKLTPQMFEKLFTEARVIVAHAGIGTILSAQRHQKPLVIVPRRFDLGEHRNDHQSATARELEKRIKLCVVWDENTLHDAINIATPPPNTSHPEGTMNPLHSFLHTWINQS